MENNALSDFCYRSADGKDLTHADPASLTAALAGPGGSTLTLSIDRGSGPQTVQATRGPYYFPPLDSRMLPDGVGYLRLAEFVISGTTLPNGDEVLADLDRRLDELDAQGAQSLILDLRNNGGGNTHDQILGQLSRENFLHELVQDQSTYPPGSYRDLSLRRLPHIGGNVHDHVHSSGVRIHTYGPHYFRTSSEQIWEFALRFARSS